MGYTVLCSPKKLWKLAWTESTNYLLIRAGIRAKGNCICTVKTNSTVIVRLPIKLN
jgi:hypothetical protein